MIPSHKIIFLGIFFFHLMTGSNVLWAQGACPTPLYTDPAFKGVADPEVIWNEQEQAWWMYYTARRSICAGCPMPALAIGVASSKDWINWKQEGYISIDGIGGSAMEADILWAPGITRDGDTYHMILTYKKGNGDGSRGGIAESLLLHLTAPKDDLLKGWITRGVLHVPTTSIDGTFIYDGHSWNIFHRDIIKKGSGFNTFRIRTDDLNKKVADWNYLGPAKGDVNDKSKNGYSHQEAPFTFYWKGLFWLMTDPPGMGLPVYESKDLERWKLNSVILTKNGTKPIHQGRVRHPGVVVLEDCAFLFYFNQPYQKITGHPEQEMCVIQIAELKYENGVITCDREAMVVPPKNLVPKDGEWGQKKKKD